MQAVLKAHLDRPAAEWWWVGLATVMGLMVAVLPLQLVLLLVGGLGWVLLVLIEPALAFVTMLMIAPFKTLIETELGWALPLDIGQLALMSAVGAWIAHKILHRENFWRMGGSPLLPPLYLFLLVTGFTLPSAYALGTGINEWVKWAEIALLVIITLDFAYDRWQWLLVGLMAAASVQALIGIYEFRGGSGAAHLWILEYRYFRAFGTFGQPNPFGAFMGLILPLALGTTWGYLTTAYGQWRRQETWRANASGGLLFGAFSALLLIGLLVSWSRGAWLGLAVASVVLVWLAPKRRIIGTVSVLGGGLAAGLLSLAGLLPQSITDRVLSFTEDFAGFGDVRGVYISDENFAVVERLAHWQAALGMAEKHPWLGVGFGNYEAAYPEFSLVNWPIALGHAHNYYINLLAETGIFGLGAYLLLWSVVIGLTWQVLHRTHDLERGIALGLMGVWTHLAVHSLVDKLYVNNLFLHIGVMLGILAVLNFRAGCPVSKEHARANR